MQRTLVFWCVMVLLSAATSVAGQTYQGGIRGQIRDLQGVIPGAEVSLINEDTNATRTAVSNEVGEYSFPNVLPATYTLKVSMTRSPRSKLAPVLNRRESSFSRS